MVDHPTLDPWQSPSADTGRGGPRIGGPGIPWETEQSVSTLWATILGVLLEPSKTFQGAEVGRGIGAAFGFALIVSTVSGWLQLGMRAVTGQTGFEELPEGLEWMQSLLGEPSLIQLVALPVVQIISLFGMAVCIHVCLMIVGGAQRGFDETFRAMAFVTGATSVIGIIPYVGQVLAGVLFFASAAIALRELQGTTTARALLAIFLPMLALVALLLVVAFAFIGLWTRG